MPCQIGCLLLLVLAATALLYTLTEAAVFDSNVRIEHGKMSDVFRTSQQQDVGEWSYNWKDKEEATFFAEENAQRGRWLNWISELQHWREKQLVKQQQQLQQNEEEPKGKQSKNEGGLTVSKSPRGSGDVTTGALQTYFIDSTKKKRAGKRLKAMSRIKAKNFSTDDILTLLDNQTSELWSAIESNVETNLRLVGVLEKHFFGSVSRVNAMEPLSASNWSFFIVPLVTDTDVQQLVGKEVADLRLLLSQVEGGGGGGAKAAAVTGQLDAITHILQKSHSAMRDLTLLSLPLAAAASDWVEETLKSVRGAIVSNDEATEAKRTEMRNLVKRQARLRDARADMSRYTILLNAVTQHLKSGLPTDAVVFGLELVAKLRYGDAVVNSSIDFLPALSRTAPLCGLLETELVKYLFQPFGFSVIVSCIMIWLTEEVTEWCVVRLRRWRTTEGRTTRGDVVQRSGAAHYRRLLVAANLIGKVVPVVVPLLTLFLNLRSSSELPWAALLMLRPSQCSVLGGVLVVLMLLNLGAARAVRYCFGVIDPSVYRRRHVKEV